MRVYVDTSALCAILDADDIKRVPAKGGEYLKEAAITP